MKRLEGKVALVTGAGSGFGQGIAEAFAREGAKVAVVDIDVGAARAVASALGAGAVALTADVAKSSDVDGAVRDTLAAFGGLDVVVNNAGISHRNRPMLEVDEAEFDRVFAVNVKSLYLFARAAVPVMRQRGGGVFINVGSTAGLRPRPGLTWYNGTKGAVHTITKSMAVELAPDHIRVCAVNVKSLYLFARAAVPVMRQRGGGVFINVGSTAGLRPRPGLTWYNGTKGAVHTITKSMAVELAPDHIRVCALAPVAGETPLLATFMGEDTPEKRAAFRSSIPLGRLSTPQDIANAALFLASDEAGMVTGVVLEVDGGRCI
jgi:3-oxoacyl-[acyl-carrier protein] reductase